MEKELKAEKLERDFLDMILFIPGTFLLCVFAMFCLPIAFYDFMKRRWKLFWLWRASRY